jgi:SRF-type transcription factor (DNA-binding and dimerisation domain)
MARNKIKLQFISNNALRRSALKKRQRGLLKKVREISILCGVDSCGIVYSSEGGAPEVWPQPEIARRILITFYNLPEPERARKMTNHMVFMEERVATSRDKAVNRDNGNDKLEVRAILYEGFSGHDFSGLGKYYSWAVGEALDELITKVYGRISYMSLPPQARTAGAPGAGMGSGVYVGPAVALAIAAPATLASAEAEPSNQALRGSEFSEEELGDIWSSDGASEDGDSEDDDE